MKQTDKAVVVIDMLEDFVYGALKNERSARIIPSLKRLLAHARQQGWLVVYANDAHLPGDPEEKVWGPHALAGSPGAQVIEDIAPEPSDVILPKRTYSAFHETGLDLLLRQHGVRSVIVTGQHTHICVRHTSADAFTRNYDILVPHDAVESFSQAEHESGLDYLKMCYGVTITDVEQLTEG